MEFQVEKQGQCLSKLTITVPKAQVDEAFERALRSIGKKANLPGYRPGKVPRSLIERQYGQQVMQDAIDHIVRESLFPAIDGAKLQAVSMPTLDLLPPARGQDFTYTAQVEVQPDITLTKTEGLPVPPLNVEPDPKGLDDAIEHLRTQAAQTVPVQGRSTVQMGDFVMLDYEGKIDNVPFQGGKAQNALVEVVAGEYIPGFAEGLVGHEVPGEVAVPVTFPEDYGAKHLAGKEAVFTMNLKELKVRDLPAVDDEFAKAMGYDDLTALKASITERLATQAKKEGEGARRRSLMEALIAANPFEVPPSMIDTQVERIIEDTRDRMERMTGRKANLTPDDLADIRASSRADAEFQVRSGLLLMAVSRAEGLTIDDDAVAAEVARVAEANPEQAEAVKRAYEDQERKEELRFRLLEEKVVAALLAKSVPQAA